SALTGLRALNRNPRTFEPSNPRTFGPSDPRTLGPSDPCMMCRSFDQLRGRYRMKMRALLLMVAILAAGAALPAQEPVVGVKDPESLFKDSNPKLNKNKQAALHIMRELLQCNQWDRAGEWLTKAYHQHNPNAASGLDGVITFFTKVLKVKRTDTCNKLTAEVVAGEVRRH